MTVNLSSYLRYKPRTVKHPASLKAFKSRKALKATARSFFAAAFFKDNGKSKSRPPPNLPLSRRGNGIAKAALAGKSVMA
jgi:hypothetical protein